MQFVSTFSISIWEAKFIPTRLYHPLAGIHSSVKQNPIQHIDVSWYRRTTRSHKANPKPVSPRTTVQVLGVQVVPVRLKCPENRVIEFPTGKPLPSTPRNRAQTPFAYVAPNPRDYLIRVTNWKRSCSHVRDVFKCRPRNATSPITPHPHFLPGIVVSGERQLGGVSCRTKD